MRYFKHSQKSGFVRGVRVFGHLMVGFCLASGTARSEVSAPEPKVVVAVGACGISGGIFGRTYATVGGVDRVVPVDIFIPGCPPRPQALIHGILLAVGRIAQKEVEV